MTTGGGHPDDRGVAEPSSGPIGARHPATTGLLRYFEYGHLPPHLQAVSKPIGDLAHELVEMLPDGPELSTMLRKFLEGKDCAVRAALDVPPEQLVSTREAAGARCTARHPDLYRCALPVGHDGQHRIAGAAWT